MCFHTQLGVNALRWFSLVLIFCKAGGYKSIKLLLDHPRIWKQVLRERDLIFRFAYFPPQWREGSLQLECAPHPQKLRRQDVPQR